MDTDPVRLIRVVRPPSNAPFLLTAEPPSAAEYATRNMASTDRNRLVFRLDESRRAANEQVGDNQTYEGEERREPHPPSYSFSLNEDDV